MLPLETTRLLLRGLVPEDAPALHAVWGDAETMRWFPRVRTLEEVQEWIALQQQRYASGSGLRALVLRETGALIGDCGLSWQMVEGVAEPEIGYHVNRAYWNRGYATEAARAVRDDTLARLGCDHVISLIRPGNLPSQRVAEKNGMKLNRVVLWSGYGHCIYRLAKESPQ